MSASLSYLHTEFPSAWVDRRGWTDGQHSSNHYFFTAGTLADSTKWYESDASFWDTGSRHSCSDHTCQLRT